MRSNIEVTTAPEPCDGRAHLLAVQAKFPDLSTSGDPAIDLAAWGIMTDRLRYVLHRLAQGARHKDIAAELGVSNGRVGQLAATALKRYGAALRLFSQGAPYLMELPSVVRNPFLRYLNGRPVQELYTEEMANGLNDVWSLGPDGFRQFDEFMQQHGQPSLASLITDPHTRAKLGLEPL
jgi:DNA-binding CsgD family transcriptional regulator